MNTYSQYSNDQYEGQFNHARLPDCNPIFAAPKSPFHLALCYESFTHNRGSSPKRFPRKKNLHTKITMNCIISKNFVCEWQITCQFSTFAADTIRCTLHRRTFTASAEIDVIVLQIFSVRGSYKETCYPYGDRVPETEDAAGTLGAPHNSVFYVWGVRMMCNLSSVMKVSAAQSQNFT